jgi:hypothetical protein
MDDADCPGLRVNAPDDGVRHPYAPFLGLDAALPGHGGSWLASLPCRKGGARFRQSRGGRLTGVYVIELNATARGVFWANGLFGIVLVPASWPSLPPLLGPGAWVTRRSWRCLRRAHGDGVPGVDEPWHHWFRGSSRWNREPGPAFWIHAAYSAPWSSSERADSAPCEGRASPRRGQAATLLIAAFAPGWPT